MAHMSSDSCLMVLTDSATSPLSFLLSISMSTMATMPLRGLRSSWQTNDKNSDLASDATWDSLRDCSCSCFSI